jgi:hypothetical protein
VVLSELKEHVQPLLNSLPQFHVSGHDVGNASSINNIQNCALRSQLQIVLQNARNLNGNGSACEGLRAS